MGLDVKRPRVSSLWLFICGWVALSKATHNPCIYVKIDEQTLQATLKKSLTESHIMEEVADAAAKNKDGNKAIKGIKGLKIKDMQLPNITITIDSEKGIGMNVSTQMTVAGKSFIGGTMEITMKTKMKTQTSLQWDPEKQLKFEVTKCAVELVSCKTNLPSSMLPKIVNKFLNSTLGKVLPGMMCPAADKVVLIMEERIKDAFAPTEIGHHGTMQYKLGYDPDLVPEYIGLCLRPVLHDKDHKEMAVPQEPPPCDDLPEKKEGSTQISLPVNVLNAMMGLFTDDFSCEITSSNSALLTADKLAALLPSAKDSLPPSGKVKIKISPQEAPTFSLGIGESSLVVHSTVDVINQDTGKAVLSFSMTQNWESKFSVDKDKLKIELHEVRTGDIADISLSVGEAGVEALKGYMGEIVRGVCLPKVSKIMAEEAMSLPNMLGSTYDGCEITTTIVKDTLVVDVKPEEVALDLAALTEKISSLHDKHH